METNYHLILSSELINEVKENHRLKNSSQHEDHREEYDSDESKVGRDEWDYERREIRMKLEVRLIG